MYDNTLNDEDPLHIHLYPFQYKSSLHNACDKNGAILESLRVAADQIQNNTSVDGYSIHRWKWEDSNTTYPDWGKEVENTTDVVGEFRDWLRNKNGTGDDIYGLTGVHQLVHLQAGGAACEDDAGGYAPNGAGGERHGGGNAFTTGMIAWSPYCLNTDLMRAAAIQEAVHACYEWENSDPYVREHSLGTIDSNADCSPMLAYHWDNDNNEDPDFRCPREINSPPGGHRKELTSCVLTEINNELN